MSHAAQSGLPSSELDVFACPLDGVNQIEASAGTGKTWNICALYVRLLLEKDLGADEILVVTFTKAATAELHERIRARLAQLAHALDTGDDGGDPFVARLFETTLAPGRGLDPQTAAKRVRRALRAFDQAAIHTIHAFCQRALQEAPFAAAMPFAFEMEADDGALRFELAADFWRTRVEPVAAAQPAFAEWLVEYGAGPAALDAQLARRLKKPLARLRWDGLHAADDGAESTARAHFDAAAAIWRDERGVLDALLADAQPSLNQRSHKPDAVSEALDAWARYFEQASAVAALPRAALKLTQSSLEKATKKGGTTPRHAFFDVAQALEAAVAAVEAAQRARWLSLVEQWLDIAPAELAQRKRTRRVVSFDDLLANLYRALDAHPWLRETLRARYPAALIDEFQDTDPLQFAIFDTIFAPAGPLFLVGDPKQAIYSFRAADLHTYLAARARASARYTLAVNQRSTPAIVDACNRVFGANPRAFVLDGLDYEPVRAGSRVRAPLVDATDPLAGAGDFRVWTLPAGDDVLTKRDAQRHAAHACAAEIARLMRGARERAVTLGGEPLAASDIAVLVQTHRQGSLVKRVLAAWGIGSVELAQASVFATIDAEQLERVLAAIDAPGDLRRLRSALASDWFGLDAAALWRLEQGDAGPGGTEGAASDASGNDGHARAAAAGAVAPPSADTDAMGWVERFSRYRLLWRERGFAVMWRTLAGELRIAERLMAGPDGERRVTDINHLAELTQARASAQPGIAPTLRWLAAQRLDGGGDDAQLRLESDRNLVQIVTVHKSKGLEYAIVFCPFLNDGGLREPPGSGLPDAREYHDESGVAVLHYGCDEEAAERASREAAREQAAERARLVYVALTRAVYRCYLVAGTYQSSRSTKEARRSVLNWLVAGAGRDFDAWLKEPPEDAELAVRWQALAGGPVTLGALPVPARREPLEAGHDANATRAARRAKRGLRDAWRIASFSSLASAIARDESGVAGAADDEMRPDHDALAAAVGADVLDAFDTLDAAGAIAEAAAIASEPAEDDILAFPRGAAAGECLHRLLELSDFSDASTWPPAAQRALHERPVEAEHALAGRLPAMMTRLVADLAATELVPGMRLAALDPARRLTEMEFLFPAPALDFNALRRLLAAHGYPDVALEAGTLAGFIKGFIDMIVEHDGRFWIVDWKSNHLGTTPDAYGERALDAAMAHHAYHLQALLYTVALHRYLRVRMRDYDYDAHVAGYLYLFVRGVRPDWRSGGASAGVHARRPARALIEALDALMLEGGA
ncbi:exodeoxyribonuclease V subunit beta [Burkholderia thailandensis]|uniref:RecBCD enzyme subunit RecB n=4 Tax=Burkholderia thailandensis TaxID=57975 RepID=A0AAW9D2T8_BURTH|nr:exodeoxyribonuclease V subunit beta [Burkholderia thailandensis]MCS3394498.1 exodeoxyribonuclease V subunit beta [Burkholderia thailandensis]MCS6427605.1 exodeoxyribonuclease V subunit beta [Burkholderia thailandensis]MCS6455079.1 exodeoxyribonuclease V subunit beta [Burkholderia thailandensis]MCS6466770.1 exodeoxyribonuclease V subunit beta [Burkholderia thailandensis]MCS6484427.1 exodeoxyribonuclease V subunit beta [Burkholderia thailandensis]